MAQHWPAFNLPDWLPAKTEGLTRQLGDKHSDVLFFRDLLKVGRLEDTTMDRVTSFIATSKTLEASQMAIDLSNECILAAGLVAEGMDSLPTSYVLHCGRGSLEDAFPQPCRNRFEAIKTAEARLNSPNCPTDIWLRLEGPDGTMDTDAIRLEITTREDLLILASKMTNR
jgi:hypothetical protein